MLNTVSKLLLALILFAPGTLLAHDARPLYLQINELDKGQTADHDYTLKMQVPPSIEADNRPYITLPGDCQHEAMGLVVQLRCNQPLTGKTLQVSYPKFNPSIATLIRVSLANNVQYQTLLSPGETQWEIPQEQSTATIISEYTQLGIEHILVGWDHLLFLLCLLMITGTLKRTVVTISGFTLAHSLTLVLTTLGVIRLPIAPVEALIALSILFLAAEIIRNNRNTIAWRYPVAVSTLFGLIHGFGFASVLQEIGLPQTELATALLFFNVGVEVGQLMFVALVMVLLHLLQRWHASALQTATHLMIYAAGSLAAFWTIQRVASF